MNGVLPSQGTTSRLRDSRNAMRDERDRGVESVRRRLTFAPAGLTEAEINKRCGWPVGARVYLRILEERREAHQTPDRVWHLGPGSEQTQAGGCNPGATSRRPTVVGGPRDWLPHLDESAPVTVETVSIPQPKPKPRPPDPAPLPSRALTYTMAPPKRARASDPRQQVLMFRPPPSARIVPRGPGRPPKGQPTMGDQLIAILPTTGLGVTTEELVELSGLNKRQVTQSLTRAKRERRVECSGPKKCTRWKRRKETR